MTKIFGRCIFIDLYCFLEPRLSSYQNGFLKGRSCTRQLFVYPNKIYQGLENRRNVQVVYTYYEKAFDSVDHQLLLRKLSDMVGRDRLLQIIRLNLSGRYYQVRISNSLINILLDFTGTKSCSNLKQLS